MDAIIILDKSNINKIIKLLNNFDGSYVIDFIDENPLDVNVSNGKSFLNLIEDLSIEAEYEITDFIFLVSKREFSIPTYLSIHTNNISLIVEFTRLLNKNSVSHFIDLDT
jgi:uncharacterized protein (DUF1015 family)